MAVKKKQPSKFKKILSAFNPKSPKGGMLLFALIFALGGGGYFLYSSFASINPQTITYYEDSCFTGWSKLNSGTSHVACSPVIHHTVGSNGGVQGYDVGYFTGWQLTSPSSHFGWYGPYRTMTIPAGAKGIQACYRYEADNLTNGPITYDVYFDITSNGGTNILKSTYPPLHIAADSAANNPWPTHVFCLQKPATVGTTYKQVETRVRLVAIHPGPNTGGWTGITIIRTNLSYY